MSLHDRTLLQRLQAPVLDASERDVRQARVLVAVQAAAFAGVWLLYGVAFIITVPAELGGNLTLFIALGLSAMLAQEMPRAIYDLIQRRRERTRLLAAIHPAPVRNHPAG
jgi:hypothetical protein